jgi:hypothetical protein
MFSSFFPWELKTNFPNLLEEGAHGLYAFSCYDPFLEKIFLNSIPKHFLSGSSWTVLNPQDLSTNWVDENLLTLDFFSSEQSYKVILAENLDASVVEQLQDEKIDWQGRYFILSYQKENKSFEALKKNDSVHTIKVKEPRFWENGKLLKFLCEQTGVYISYDVQNYIVESVVNEPGEFLHVLKKIALLGADPKSLSVEAVKKHISVGKLDQFELARLLGEKKHRDFFTRLLVLSEDYTGMMLFFRFIQGHILKLIDPSFVASKSRASKYDKQIEGHSRLWKEAELKDELRFFSKLEILAKSKSKDLGLEIKLRIVSAY